MANNTLRAHKRADTVKWVVIFLVVLGLIGAVIGLSVKLDRQTTIETLGGEAYSIGLIGDDGANKDGNTAIYTRKGVTVNGLRCSLAEDAKIKYQIFFYDKDGKFISASEELSADYDGEDIPASAKTARIMIVPTEDEDGKVSLVEVLGYAGQLTVTVER